MSTELFYITVGSILTDGYEKIYKECGELKGWDTVCETIETKVFTIQHTGVSSRVLNHWNSKGILYGLEDYNAQEWKKFSLTNLIWIRILKELRRFGLSLGKLKITHDSIFRKDAHDPFRIFKLYIALCLQIKSPEISLVVFNDGYGFLVHNAQLEILEVMADGKHPYIKININNLCSEYMNSSKYSFKKELSPILQGHDHLILNALQEDCDEIIIKNNEKEYDISLKNMRAGNQKISDLLHETNYGEITAKIENGCVVSTKSIKRKKIKK